MSFRMRCPKCHSSNLDLEEDQRAFLGGGRHQVLLHCYTCGMILYGEARIQEEFERQRVEWEKQAKERQERAARARAARAARAAVRPRPKPRPKPAAAAPVPAPTPAPAKQAPEPEPVVATAEPTPAPPAASKPPEAAVEKVTDPSLTVAPKPPRVHAEAAPAAEAAPKVEAKPKTKPKAKAKPAAEPAPAADGSIECAWKSCVKPARPNSKYCSRNCSNKNARARHAARKREKKTDTQKTDGAPA